jgi:hypothetical protein
MAMPALIDKTTILLPKGELEFYSPMSIMLDVR